MKELGNFLVKRRKELGLSQGDVSKFLGWGNGQFVSNIERGLCDMPPKHFRRISKLLNIDIKVLCNLALQDFKETLMEEIKRRS